MFVSLYSSGFKGGEAKSNDEIWQYLPSGKLQIVGNNHLQYYWTGEVFQPAENSKLNAGTGVFDGINLFWYPPSSSKTETTQNRVGNLLFYSQPTHLFTYQEDSNSKAYFDASNPDYKWVWTRHFLASSSGDEPEWLVEGEVPKHVVMFMQIFRLFTTKYPECAVLEQKPKTKSNFLSNTCGMPPASMDSAQIGNIVKKHEKLNTLSSVEHSE